ncbi:MAG TPA: C4-dicarboxylic acid transporter DauA [Vicinamibacteria bacterium]|nr:C4-dicarboxylic acid transporter DauA [Vicinamibacteria bacterium]
MNRVGFALRNALTGGYRWADLKADLMAGTVVGIVALPLSMALAIASGVAPQHGLYTAIVGGFVIALLGGSRVQVSGPTAAFVVILAPIASRFGLGGLLLATALAGIILIAMGAAGMGRFIEFVPYPVTTGFTAGIAVVIGTLQIKDLLGLSAGKLPEHYLDKIEVLWAALPSARWPDFAIGAFTLAVLILWPRLTHRIPGPLVALSLGAGAAFLLARAVSGFEVATIASRFSHQVAGLTVPGIPRQLPLPLLPWHLPGPDGAPLSLSFRLLRDLTPSAFAIAMLGAIESLLSAVVADGMTGGQHDPDTELLAQGIGNLAAPCFGGIAATGAIARTATSIRSGARSPVAAAFHAVFVLLAVLLLAPLLGYLPMASLAALLLVVAWNMSESKHFLHLLRVAPRSDIVVLLTCFGLTVFFDMVVSVTAGILIAALLFMRRMAEVSGVTLVGEGHPDLDRPLPRGVVLYDIAGPLFFGAAQKAMMALRTVEQGNVQVVVLDLEHVPAIDATGLVGLESLVKRLNEAKIKVILVGMQDQPLRALAKAGWRNRQGRLRIFRSFERGIAVARRSAAGRATREA